MSAKTSVLRGELHKALLNWNERSLFTISGIRGLTRSDLDTLALCCDYYDAHGNLDGLAYFPIVVELVLRKAGLYSDQERRNRNESHVVSRA